MRKKETVTKAVKLIQNHERARQSRIYFLELFTIEALRKSLVPVPGQPKPPPPPEPEVLNKAAVKIETIYRGHQAKQLIKRKEGERRLLIGR